MRCALICLLLLAAPAAADELLPGEFRIEFRRELIGYQKDGKQLLPARFPTLRRLERTLADDTVRAVLFFKLYDDEHNHFAPRYEPLARRLAFIRADINRRTSKIRLLELPRGRPSTLQADSPDSYDYMFNWSPRYAWLGEGPPYLVYASQAGRKGQLNLYLARGAARARITSGPEITKHPDFHPSLPRLLYEQQGRIHLLEFPRDPATLKGVPPSRRLASGKEPEWAPDGKRFVYCREVGRKAGRAIHEVSVHTLALGRETPIHRGPDTALLRNPSWSPDGRHIAFYRGDRQAFGWELYLTEAERPLARRVAARVLVENYFDDVGPAWSPAGDKLFYFSAAGTDGYYKIHWVDTSGRRGTVDYSDEFTTATDLALPREPSGLAEAAFVAVERLSQGVYVVVLNHW